jgi:hypothetical protein
MKKLLALALGFALLSGPAFAADNVAVTPGSGKTMACKDVATVCFPQQVPVDSTGTEKFTAGNPGSVGIVGAVPAGANTIGNVGIVGTLPALAAGSALVGKVGIDQTTPGTTNAVQVIGTLPAQSLTSSTTGGATPYHLASAATTNSTLISTGAHSLYNLSVINTTATLYYLRVYDQAAAPTCSSATGAVHSYPIPASTTGAGFTFNLGAPGEAYALGIGFCITGGGADTDVTSAATGVYLNLSYK